MLKPAPSCVLTFAKILNVPQRVRLRFWLASALLDDRFEHPV